MARKLNIYIHGLGRDAAPRRRVHDSFSPGEQVKWGNSVVMVVATNGDITSVKSGGRTMNVRTSELSKASRDSLISGGRRPEAHNTKKSPIVADMRTGAKVSDRMVVKWIIGNDETKLYNSFKEADQANKRNPGGGRTGTDKIRQVLVEA